MLSKKTAVVFFCFLLSKIHVKKERHEIEKVISVIKRLGLPNYPRSSEEEKIPERGGGTTGYKKGLKQNQNRFKIFENERREGGKKGT